MAYDVTVIGGTRRFANVSGNLSIGPIVQSAQTNCDLRVGICLDWTDTALVAGTLHNVRQRQR